MYVINPDVQVFQMNNRNLKFLYSWVSGGT